MKTFLPSANHSADVRIDLCIDGHVLSVAQLGPGYVILTEPSDHPPTTAEIAMSVDGQERRWQVQLVDGIVAGKSKINIRPCG